MGNKKTKILKVKEPIKVRFKKLANENKSVYLDYYTNGKREYEFLKLYLIPEATDADKAINAETLRLANAIKAQKIVAMQNAAHGFSVSGGRSKMNLIDYIQHCITDKKKSKNNYLSLCNHLTQYSGDKTTFKQVTKEYCIGFIEYLKTAKSGNFEYTTNHILGANSQFHYFRLFNVILNCAIADDIISSNPLAQINPENKPKKRTAEVCFLNMDEVELLSKAPTVPIVKSAFLFSCMSGLRFSDIKGLTWNKLQKDNAGKLFINYMQKKTKKQEYLPIAQKAIQYLPQRPDTAKDNDFVFNLPTSVYVNIVLKKWAAAAGITKHLTFHVARHTNATLLLSLDVPIETVSKILGHSDIQTTQIYAKVINKSVQAAAAKLDEVWTV